MIPEKIIVDGIEFLIDDNSVKNAQDIYIDAQNIVMGLDMREQIGMILGHNEAYHSLTKELNSIYEKISSNPLSKLLDDNQLELMVKYINLEPVTNHMTGSENKKDWTIDDFLKFIGTATNILGTGLAEGLKTYNKISFRQALEKKIEDKKIYTHDSDKLNKIFDSYLVAEFLNRKYHTSNIYNTVRKECIADYNSLLNANSQNFILEYVSPEFLKVKKNYSKNPTLDKKS